MRPADVFSAPVSINKKNGDIMRLTHSWLSNAGRVAGLAASALLVACSGGSGGSAPIAQGMACEQLAGLTLQSVTARWGEYWAVAGAPAS